MPQSAKAFRLSHFHSLVHAVDRCKDEILQEGVDRGSFALVPP